MVTTTTSLLQHCRRSSASFPVGIQVTMSHMDSGTEDGEDTNSRYPGHTEDGEDTNSRYPGHTEDGEDTNSRYPGHTEKIQSRPVLAGITTGDDEDGTGRCPDHAEQSQPHPLEASGKAKCCGPMRCSLLSTSPHPLPAHHLCEV